MNQRPQRSIDPHHEKDARWTAVDQYVLQHLAPPPTPFASALATAAQLSEEHGLPSIEVSALQGRFLATQCMLRDARRVLEVGTLGGYSTLWLASAGPRVHVTTVEVAPKHHRVAAQAFAAAGVEDRVESLLGSGLDVLPRLRAEVEAGARPPYDFVFIDADKMNNLNYFNEAILMCSPRACIIVDNVVRRGRLADDEKAQSDPGVVGARQVIEAVGKDDRLMGSTLLQTVGEKNYDGFLMCIVK